MAEPIQTYFERSVSETTGKYRRSLLASSIALLGMSVFGIVPSKVTWLGIEFSQADKQILLFFVAAIVAYFFVGFWIYARTDWSSLKNNLEDFKIQKARERINTDLEDLQREQKVKYVRGEVDSLKVKAFEYFKSKNSGRDKFLFTPPEVLTWFQSVYSHDRIVKLLQQELAVIERGGRISDLCNLSKDAIDDPDGQKLWEFWRDWLNWDQVLKAQFKGLTFNLRNFFDFMLPVIVATIAILSVIDPPALKTSPPIKAQSPATN